MTEKCLFPEGCIAVLGMFDGVHIGHQALLKKAAELKKKLGLQVIMVTFQMHPKALLGNQPELLTTNEQKEKLALWFGADQVLFEPFDQKMRSLSPEQFVKDYLVQKLNAKCVVVGENYRFGYRHAGSPELLKQYGGSFLLDIVPSVKAMGIPVSSTRIRELLQQGELKEALFCLGHPLETEGRVEHGRQVGRRLGFCTANVEGNFPPLKHGVYLTRCLVRDRWLPSVSNFGVLPTFSLGNAPRLECHILHFYENLYQKTLTVRFEAFLRPERKFSDEAALAEQVKADIAQAENYFSKCL